MTDYSNIPVAWLKGQPIADESDLPPGCIISSYFDELQPSEGVESEPQFQSVCIVLRWPDGSKPEPPVKPDTGLLWLLANAHEARGTLSAEEAEPIYAAANYIDSISSKPEPPAKPEPWAAELRRIADDRTATVPGQTWRPVSVAILRHVADYIDSIGGEG